MSKRTFSAMQNSSAQPQIRPYPGAPIQNQPPQNQSSSSQSHPPQAQPAPRPMRLEDIVNDDHRKKTLQLLQQLPTLNVEECYNALKKYRGNVNKAGEQMFQLEKLKRDKNLPMNEFIDPDTTRQVREVQRMCPGASTQTAYLAVRTQGGDLERAKRHAELLMGKDQSDLDERYGPI